jgi:hypothetical protein
MEVMGWIVAGLFMLLSVVAVSSAYNNGVNDGYGFSREPDNPGYQRAGNYLVHYCSHRWPELRRFALRFHVL